MSLKGKTVLITRPEKQVNTLYELVKREQATPILLPLLSIKAFESEQLDLALSNFQDYDKVIFVSRNAVEICFAYLNEKQLSLSKQVCLAVGTATLRILTEQGYESKQDVSEHATTETLLMDEELSDTNIRDKSVLIVRGKGGRETLGDELKNRGANVTYAEVYKREKVSYSLAQKREIISTKPDVIVLTSNEGINAYYELFHQLETGMIANKPLVVLSERNKIYAEDLGFSGAIQIAEKTSDQGLLEACVKHFN